MQNDNTKDTPEYKAMADAAIGVLDTRFLKALTDPTRIQLVKKLILLGACDVTTISGGLSQDRSVISRHLNILEQAGITASRKDGRRVIYDLDGPYVVQKVTLILEALRPMADLCKPFQAIVNKGEVA
ncbi:ArsR/SmtB family transcription factor [Hellea balneolensis]|uniref:ArsR/SmtB family transcription factor n=1 Tax=Hellea balneolensis TaxID=287478 RepID=UPI0004101AD2|nr:metalloregulator ArsR/SmtB family transcription factor [Hellea balneolensis]